MYTDINGCRLYYEVQGAGGPPILCLHGGPGLSSGDETKAWVGPLVQDHTCVFYDHRGNGRSDDPPEETLTHTQLVRDAEALRAHLGLETVALFGGSYGGYIALEYALTYPERVSHLILRGTAAWGGPPNEALESALSRGVAVDATELRRLFDGQVRDNADYQALFRAIFPLYSTRFDPSAVDAAMAKRHWHYRTHNKVYGIERRSYDLRARLGEIRARTLVLCGRHDWITPPPYSEELARGIPGADLVLFGRAGHAAHADVGERFYTLVRDFLHAER